MSTLHETGGIANAGGWPKRPDGVCGAGGLVQIGACLKNAKRYSNTQLADTLPQTSVFYVRELSFSRALLCLVMTFSALAAPPLERMSAPRRDGAKGAERRTGDNTALGITGTLTLRDALALALGNSPRLIPFSVEIRMAEARELQARLLPNPELSLEIEDVRLSPGPSQKTRSFSSENALSQSGTNSASDGAVSLTPSLGRQLELEREQGAHSGFVESAFTIRLSQLIELGGKRAKRIRQAKKDHDRAAWEYEIARVDLAADVATAFVGVLSAQQRVKIGHESLDLAERVLATIRTQIDAGKVSPLEANGASIEVAQAESKMRSLEHELQAARLRLASTWGATTATFEIVEGDLTEARIVPTLADLDNKVLESVDLQRWSSEIDHANATYQLERANRVPDPTVSLGIRTTGLSTARKRSVALGTTEGLPLFNSSTGGSEYDSKRDNTLVLEISVPLPVFNRNQGSIREAEYGVDKTEAEMRATEATIRSELAIQYELLLAADDRVKSIHNKILPKTKANLDSMNEGYKYGKFGVLNLLDAQRSHFDALAEYVDALGEYQLAVVQLERISGTPLSIENSDTTRPGEE